MAQDPSDTSPEADAAGERRVYTRGGDDGSTGLLYGGRVAKDSAQPTAYGDVDEAQSAIGLARAAAGAEPELGDMLLGLERDLWVVMAELACNPEKLGLPGLIRLPSLWCPARTRWLPGWIWPEPSVGVPSVHRWRPWSRGRQLCRT